MYCLQAKLFEQDVSVIYHRNYPEKKQVYFLYSYQSLLILFINGFSRRINHVIDRGLLLENFKEKNHNCEQL